MSEIFCSDNKYHRLAKDFEHAIKVGDTKQQTTIAQEYREFAKKCGHFPQGQWERMLKTPHPKQDASYAKNCAYTITRSLDAGDNFTAHHLVREILQLLKLGKDKKITYRNFERYIVNEDGTLSLPESEERSLPPTPNLHEEYLEKTLPDICNASCPYSRHCGSYPEQVGKPCNKKWKFKKNPTATKKKAPFMSSKYETREAI